MRCICLIYVKKNRKRNEIEQVLNWEENRRSFLFCQFYSRCICVCVCALVWWRRCRMASVAINRNEKTFIFENTSNSKLILVKSINEHVFTRLNQKFKFINVSTIILVYDRNMMFLRMVKQGRQTLNFSFVIHKLRAQKCCQTFDILLIFLTLLKLCYLCFKYNLI